MIDRFANLETKSRSYKLEEPAGDVATFHRERVKLLLPWWDRCNNTRLKLIGLRDLCVEPG